MTFRRIAFVLACAAALAARAQEEAPALTYRSVTMFNQHLYYGTFERPRAMAFDAAHSELWVADSTSGILSVHQPDGAELFAFTSKQYGKDPSRIAMTPDGGEALVEGDRSHVRLFDYRGRYKGDLATTAIGAKPIIGGIAFDGDGNAYVADNRSRQIFVLRPDGSIKFQFGSPGTDEGQFESVGGITLDAERSIYVIDQRAMAVQVFDHEGNFVRGWGRHEMGAQNFSLPSGIAVDSQGRIIVSDELRHQVKIFSNDGKLMTQFGGLGDHPGELSFPADVCVDGKDRIYVLERGTARVQVFEPVAGPAAQ